MVEITPKKLGKGEVSPSLKSQTGKQFSDVTLQAALAQLVGLQERWQIHPL